MFHDNLIVTQPLELDIAVSNDFMTNWDKSPWVVMRKKILKKIQYAYQNWLSNKHIIGPVKHGGGGSIGHVRIDVGYSLLYTYNHLSNSIVLIALCRHNDKADPFYSVRFSPRWAKNQEENFLLDYRKYKIDQNLMSDDGKRNLLSEYIDENQTLEDRLAQLNESTHIIGKKKSVVKEDYNQNLIKEILIGGIQESSRQIMEIVCGELWDLFEDHIRYQAVLALVKDELSSELACTESEILREQLSKTIVEVVNAEYHKYQFDIPEKQAKRGIGILSEDRLRKVNTDSKELVNLTRIELQTKQAFEVALAWKAITGKQQKEIQSDLGSWHSGSRHFYYYHGDSAHYLSALRDIRKIRRKIHNYLSIVVNNIKDKIKEKKLEGRHLGEMLDNLPDTWPKKELFLFIEEKIENLCECLIEEDENGFINIYTIPTPHKYNEKLFKTCENFKKIRTILKFWKLYSDICSAAQGLKISTIFDSDEYKTLCLVESHTEFNIDNYIYAIESVYKQQKSIVDKEHLRLLQLMANKLLSITEYVVEISQTFSHELLILAKEIEETHDAKNLKELAKLYIEQKNSILSMSKICSKFAKCSGGEQYNRSVQILMVCIKLTQKKPSYSANLLRQGEENLRNRVLILKKRLGAMKDGHISWMGSVKTTIKIALSISRAALVNMTAMQMIKVSSMSEMEEKTAEINKDRDTLKKEVFELQAKIHRIAKGLPGKKMQIEKISEYIFNEYPDLEDIFTETAKRILDRKRVPFIVDISDSDSDENVKEVSDEYKSVYYRMNLNIFKFKLIASWTDMAKKAGSYREAKDAVKKLNCGLDSIDNIKNGCDTRIILKECKRIQSHWETSSIGPSLL